MSSNPMRSPRNGELTSGEDEDTLSSSISLSVGETSIRIKEKPNVKAREEHEKQGEQNVTKGNWWMKKTDTRLEIPNYVLAETKIKQTPSPSPDVSSSMKEFLEKEKMCKDMDKKELEAKDKDDTLCDFLASSAFDKYPSDFENATDEDIGSLLEEMSKIAGALSPNSAADRTRSKNSNKHLTEEERSVEELLEAAHLLVRKNSTSLSKSASKSDTLVPDDIIEENESLNRVQQMEAHIFQMIEEEVHKGAEIIKKSPKSEKKRDPSPGFEVLYENINILKPPKTLELQRRKFEEQKVEVSSSSDLDDPIERHSKSEDLKTVKKVDTDKDNLQKEITDVDKDFFEDGLKKSMEKAEGGISGSSSFGQEDFSHFLKLLQSQDGTKDQEHGNPDNAYTFLSKPVDGKGDNANNATDRSPEFPEKEISEILEKEFSKPSTSRSEHEIDETDDSSSKDLARQRHRSAITCTVAPKTILKSSEGKQKLDAILDAKKVGNTNDELYTVDLTPRLELFADAIPKLLAEKSTESIVERNKEVVEPPQRRFPVKTVSSMSLSQSSTIEPSALSTRKSTIELHKVNSGGSAPESRPKKKELKFCKSKSYDQICKPPFRTSLENIRVARPIEATKRPAFNTLPRRSPPILKAKAQAKPILKPAPKQKSTKSSSLPAQSSTSRTIPIKSPDLHARHAMGGGDTKYNLTKQNWEILCREERHRVALLKQQLDSEAKTYKNQIETMRVSYEKELFNLRKENIILKARVDELVLKERRFDAQPKKDTKLILMEKELEKQENLIRAYESENKKLMQETKRMHEEIKNLQKHKGAPLESNKAQEMADKIKDLEEQTLKLNLEVNDLRQRNSDAALTNDDLMQQNSLLVDELEMFKDQLKTKNDFITDRLQAMTAAELDLKRRAEELAIKLSSKTEQLKLVKNEFDKIQQNVLPLEKELLELRVKEGRLLDKLQVSKSHVEREKQLSQKLKDQVIIDNKRIMDLNRQVREMERILKRKNPDSVSALILTANSEKERVNSDKVKLLEERIATLEGEIKTKEELEQQKLLDVQRKFTDVKEKYAAQIAEVEAKLTEATVKERKQYNDTSSQTTSVHFENKCVETIKSQERTSSFEREDKKDQKSNNKPAPKSQNPKEDAHLIATIRGLKFELAAKEKASTKMTKEYQELQKTNRRLQKEREKLLMDRKTGKNTEFEKSNRVMVSSDSKLMNSKSDMNDPNSNVYQNGHGPHNANFHRSSSMQKLYNPMHYTDNNDGVVMKRLTNENDILKEELNKMNKDFMALKNKRLHDLNILQEEHEREMATLVKEYSVKIGDSKAVKLQGQINTQVAVIGHLKQQIEKLRDYKEQVVVLQVERGHLENKVKTLTEKVNYLSTPGTEQLQLLQDKITILQQRHESREMTLQTLVRDLLRNRTQCKDCKSEKGKSQQLCYFRQELDHILGMLQEIADVH